MLVLTRKRGQRITIGEIVITITHTGRNSAKIGIEAPEHLVISRDNVVPNKGGQTPSHSVTTR